MIRNYLKIAFRNLLKRKIFSAINIVGLAIGMACFIIIMLWVQNEFSYDRFHKNADQIYRIGIKGNINGNEIQASATPGKWGPALKNAFPEILNYARYVPQKRRLFKYNEKAFYEDAGAIADAAIFEIFDFPFIHGNRETALINPLNMVITEKMAKKYFDLQDPLNKTILFGEQAFIITGIIKDPPDNSHIQFDFICSIDLLEKIADGPIVDWGSDNFSTYLLLKKNVNAARLNEKIRRFILDKVPAYKEINLSTFLQPIKDIYLNHNIETYSGITGDIRYVYIFTIIAFLILLIACINYTNLATALSSIRSKEVGIRKVVGSTRKQLIIQFLSESLVMCVIAFFMAILFAELLLPTFRQLAGKNIQFNYSDPYMLLKLCAVLIGTGLAAGFYPAFYLSSIQPLSTLKATKFKGAKGCKLRKTLFITQLAISTILIIVTLCFYNQVVFMKNKPLGFSTNNIVYIPATGEIGKKYEILKNELLKNPDIVDATSKSCPLTYSDDASIVVKDGQDIKDAAFIRFLSIDYNYIEFIGLNFIAGRNFSKNFATDMAGACIMNEKAMQLLGLQDKIGTAIHTGQNETRTIVGIVKNAQFNSFKDQTEPQMYRPLKDMTSYNDGIILIKIKDYPDREQRKIYTSVLNSMNKLWDKFNPDYPFEYHFLDAAYDQLYKSEERINRIFISFTGIAIILSCLGLFGLASFIMFNRTKEIGIRKVLGARVVGITFNLIKDFSQWVIIANLLAWPIAYYAINKWLQNYANRIDITIWPFLLAGGITLLITLLTISWQAIRVATANPVECLRYE
jgi:putative ABC transport system permease protein